MLNAIHSHSAVMLVVSVLANVMLAAFVFAPIASWFVRVRKRESFVKRLCYAEDLAALEAAIMGAPGILVIANAHQVITHASREASQMLGIAHSELIGRSLATIYPNACCCLNKSEVFTSTNGEYTVILGQKAPQ